MAQKGLDLELHEKFQGVDFMDFYKLATKVIEYEELLREESLKRKKTRYGDLLQRFVSD